MRCHLRPPLLRLRIAVALPLLCAGLGAAELDATRLQQWLKQYPDADTNRDGVLTPEEAQAYARTIRGAGPARKNKERAAKSDGRQEKKPAPTHAGVSYGPHERNRFDLWLAPAARPTPLVVFIHGGGFVNGSRDAAAPEMIQGYLAAGVSFMAIDYRFRPGAAIQDILRDCARAIQFARYKAGEYNLDPARIASYGGSAGAGTLLWLAFHPDLADPASPDPVLRQSSRIVAAGALNTQATYNLLRWPELLGTPGADFTRPGEVPAFYGLKSDAELERAQGILAGVDMLGLVSRDDPPVFLYCSQEDGPPRNRGHYLHHPEHVRAVKRACDAAGVPAVAWFAQLEPRLASSHTTELRRFLLQHLQVN